MSDSSGCHGQERDQTLVCGEEDCHMKLKEDDFLAKVQKFKFSMDNIDLKA